MLLPHVVTALRLQLRSLLLVRLSVMFVAAALNRVINSTPRHSPAVITTCCESCCHSASWSFVLTPIDRPLLLAVVSVTAARRRGASCTPPRTPAVVDACRSCCRCSATRHQAYTSALSPLFSLHVVCAVAALHCVNKYSPPHYHRCCRCPSCVLSLP